MSAHVVVPPAFEPASLVGVVLDGRYELLAHLASGGMGAVFRARHVHLRKDVAVKVLRPELCAAPDLVERFRREAEIASALEHDNIVRVTDFGRSEDGLLFLAMELLTGESLFERLRREGPMAPPRAVSLLWQVCAGLTAAHELGVVHRDLKPENVFLARTSSGREVVKLLDFGIAKFARAPGEGGTQTGLVVGTPEYLSPEQAMGLPVDARADVYTVGLIGFRLLTGRHPFQGDDARELLLKQASCPVPPLAEVNPDLAAWPALCAALAAACEKDPAARPQTAAALGDRLAAALGPAFVAPPGATPVLGPAGAVPAASGAPGAARPEPARGASLPLPAALTALDPGAVRAARPRRSRRRAIGLALAAAAALLVAGGAALGLHAWRARPSAEIRALLRAGQAPEALAAAEAGLRTRPEAPELLLLRARALRRLPGRAGDAVDAYAAAQARGPLEAEDYQALCARLGEERALADRAARVLRDAPRAAVPELSAAARAGTPAQRLRAMTVLRDLGAEDAVDRVVVYGALLGEADCDVRRAAARRLGELGDAAAVPALRAAAAASVKAEKKYLFFSQPRVPACGAAEAAEALRRVQAAK